LSFVTGKPTALQQPKELVYSWSLCWWLRTAAQNNSTQSFWSAM